MIRGRQDHGQDYLVSHIRYRNRAWDMRSMVVGLFAPVVAAVPVVHFREDIPIEKDVHEVHEAAAAPDCG